MDWNDEIKVSKMNTTPGHMEINHGFHNRKNYYTKHQEQQE